MKASIKQAPESESGWPERRITVEVSSSEVRNVETCAQQITNLIAGVFAEEEVSDDCMYPIEFALDRDVLVRELEFWRLIVGSVHNGPSLAAEYTSAILKVAKVKTHGGLSYSDPQHSVGARPLIAALDSVFEDCTAGHRKLRWTSGGQKTIDAFYEYLQTCDMDKETFHDEYIKKAIDYCRLNDEESACRLLAFRLTHGQVRQKSFEYLNELLETRASPGRFKRIIDLIIGRRESYLDKAEQTYRRLANAVYGDYIDGINDVLSYVRMKIGDEYDAFCSEFENREIEAIREHCAVQRKFSNRTSGQFSTGFHQYDYGTKSWTRLS